MTLTSTTNRLSYDGNGATTSFPVTFVFWDADDLRVILRDANGAETPWTRGTQYTVSGGGSEGATGTVTVETSPTDYTPASGEKLIIKSNISDTQDTDLPPGGEFPSTSVETQIDKVVRQIQQKDEELGRSLKLQETSAFSELTVPDPSANKVLGWNAAADALENFTPNTDTYISLSAFGATLIDDTTASAARTTLGLGTMAVEATTAVPAMTYAGTQSFADNILSRPKIQDYGETVNAIGSIGGGTQDIDLESGNVVSGTVDTSTTTFTFSNPPASGTAGSFTLFLTNGGSQTVNWPASVDWAGGTAPSLTAAGVDILTFTTIDGGTTWYGFPAGLDMQ